MYLHRCLQTARLRIGADVLDVVNVHLEAYGQANREDQARILAGLVGAPAAGRPLIVAGDFNGVPPGASMKVGFPDEPTDFTTDRTLEIVRAGTGLREVFLDDAPEVPEPSTLTFPATAETRRLDFVFARGLPASTQRETIATAASDHRPIVAVFPVVRSSDAPSGSPRTSP
jgi:endonuclease/exonuclease/phosphatase family metal-dependent hydrolase